MASAAPVIANQQNALRHGLTAKTLVLATEDRAAFDHLHATLTDLWQPADDQEKDLLNALVEAEWRLARVRRAETAFFDQSIEALMTANSGLSPDQAMAQIFIDPEYRKRMSLFLRYQTSIERAVREARKALEQCVCARIADEARSAELDRAAAASRRTASINDFVSQPGAEPLAALPRPQRAAHAGSGKANLL